jgi:2-polyprenyl-3-methyl-5-hydroxy-6-metoxy-1,4-benzoquinol methylase
MKVDFIAKKCWCGNSKYKPDKIGTWYAREFGNIEYKLGKCTECGTIRTVWSSSETIEYNDSVIYNHELSLRQLNSIDTINCILKGDSLIDIGCSSGAVLNALKQSNENMTFYGIDYNEESVRRNVNKTIQLEYKDISEVAQKFDNVILLHTIEHIPDPVFFLNKIKLIMNPNAVCYISVPNINCYNAMRNIREWGALNPTQHSWHFSQKTLKRMILHTFGDVDILKEKTSWIFLPNRFTGIWNYLPFGDQLEIAFSLK